MKYNNPINIPGPSHLWVRIWSIFSLACIFLILFVWSLRSCARFASNHLYRNIASRELGFNFSFSISLMATVRRSSNSFSVLESIFCSSWIALLYNSKVDFLVIRRSACAAAKRGVYPNFVKSRLVIGIRIVSSGLVTSKGNISLFTVCVKMLALIWSFILFNPLFFSADMGTTATAPNHFFNDDGSIFSVWSTKSIIFKAITIGIPKSNSCVVK